jgi:succinyl-CoA synthetase beta subunit
MPPVWLAEHEAKSLLARAGIAVAEGAVAATEDEAAELLARIGPPVALKLSHPGLRHKTESGALELGLMDEASVRAAFRRLAGLGEGEVLVERMVPAEVELLVAARRDGVVPALVIALGGIWTEALADAAVVPLPASPAHVERALRTLRGWPLLSGGRGRPALDVAAASRLASAVGDLLLAEDLELVELNPVLVGTDGAVAVDALVAARQETRAVAA